MNINITLSEKSNLFSVVSELSQLKNTQNDNIHINITHFCGNFINAEVFVIINSIITELRSTGKNVTISIDTSQDCNILNYASRINFFKHLAIDFAEPFERRNPSGRFIEITHLSPNTYNINENFIDIFIDSFDLTPEALNSLVFVFDELICNTTRHAQSQSGGYYFCQKYPNRNTVEIFIVDSGIGISKSLNRAFPNYDEAKCLEECLKLGVTCGDGRGHGLYFISELIKRNNGHLTLLSGQSHLSLKNGQQNINKNANWDGTIVKCVFNLNYSLPIEELLKELNYST